MSNIKSFKLASGEELIAEIVEENDVTVTIKNPLGVVLQRSEKGPVIGFMPWMQSSDGPFTIKLDKIVCVAGVAQEVENGYNQIFGAGIVVPPKQLITG
jgi:hypothetical protein